MSLSPSLFRVPLSHACPHCGHKHVAKGIWFRSIRHYSCNGCSGDIVLTYEDKVKLFAKGGASSGDAPTKLSQGPERWDALSDTTIEESDPSPEG
jgi:hypothetical protein